MTDVEYYNTGVIIIMGLPVLQRHYYYNTSIILECQKGLGSESKHRVMTGSVIMAMIIVNWQVV